MFVPIFEGELSDAGFVEIAEAFGDHAAAKPSATSASALVDVPSTPNFSIPSSAMLASTLSSPRNPRYYDLLLTKQLERIIMPNQPTTPTGSLENPTRAKTKHFGLAY